MCVSVCVHECMFVCACGVFLSLSCIHGVCVCVYVCEWVYMCSLAQLGDYFEHIHILHIRYAYYSDAVMFLRCLYACTPKIIL